MSRVHGLLIFFLVKYYKMILGNNFAFPPACFPTWLLIGRSPNPRAMFVNLGFINSKTGQSIVGLHRKHISHQHTPCEVHAASLCALPACKGVTLPHPGPVCRERGRLLAWQKINSVTGQSAESLNDQFTKLWSL